MTSERKFYLFIITAILLIVFVQRSCNCNTEQPTVIADTVVKVIHSVDSGSVYEPSPEYIDRIVPLIKDVDSNVIKEDAVNDYIRRHEYDSEIPDTAKRIINDYAVSRTYKNNYPTKYGTVSVTDEIIQNKLKKQDIRTDFNIPEKTITITNAEKKRNQLYVGGELMGYKETPIQFAGAGFILKTKRDKIYTISVLSNWDAQLYVKAGMYWKIKLHK